MEAGLGAVQPGSWPAAGGPGPSLLAFRDGLHSSWSGAQGDSASSSDETSSANGDSLFSMFSGPDLVAAVKQRRYEETCGYKETEAQRWQSKGCGQE